MSLEHHLSLTEIGNRLWVSSDGIPSMDGNYHHDQDTSYLVGCAEAYIYWLRRFRNGEQLLSKSSTSTAVYRYHEMLITISRSQVMVVNLRTILLVQRKCCGEEKSSFAACDHFARLYGFISQIAIQCRCMFYSWNTLLRFFVIDATVLLLLVI